jgi:hypothetical protein
MMPLIKSEHQKFPLLGKLSTFWFYLWHQKRSERQSLLWRGTLLTLWYYLWRQKRSERWKSNLCDFQRSFQRSNFWRSDQTFNVLILLTLDVLIILKKLSTFWPFDVVIFNVPTPSPFEYCRRKLSVTEGRIFIFVGLYVGSVSVLTILSKLRTVQNKHWKINC